MLQIGKAILSFDIIEKHFLCDIPKCLGACCIEGDSGAPLEKNEILILEEIYPMVEPYLPESGKKAIQEQGFYIVDSDGDDVTPLVNDNECAYTIFENGIAKCGIEKAFLDGKISFRKPVSCHLYPIRITSYRDFDAVNYDKQDMCKAARIKGHNEKLPVYKFLKEPLIRKYGEQWYKELEFAIENLDQII